jgi:hypothetical protein
VLSKLFSFKVEVNLFMIMEHPIWMPSGFLYMIVSGFERTYKTFPASDKRHFAAGRKACDTRGLFTPLTILPLHRGLHFEKRGRRAAGRLLLGVTRYDR